MRCGGGAHAQVGGITEAVLIDHTSEKHRGKWQVVQRVSDSTWSGAAVVGGIVIDRFGYRKAFIAPLAFHLLGTLCLVPVIAVVKADERTSAARRGERDDAPERPEAAS